MAPSRGHGARWPASWLPLPRARKPLHRWTFAGLELQTGEPSPGTRDTAPAMPKTLTSHHAAELERLLAQLMGHTEARVRRYGQHLLIQMRRDESLDTIARLTETGRNHYTAAFRTHSGRWEPLPTSGDLRHTTEAVVAMLAPYLDPGA